MLTTQALLGLLALVAITISNGQASPGDCLTLLQGEAADMLIEAVEGLRDIAGRLEQRLPLGSSCSHRKRSLLPSLNQSTLGFDTPNRRALNATQLTLQFLQSFRLAENAEGLRSLACNSVKIERRLYVTACLLRQLGGVTDAQAEQSAESVAESRWLQQSFSRQEQRYKRDYILCWDCARALATAANDLVNGTLSYILPDDCP